MDQFIGLGTHFERQAAGIDAGRGDDLEPAATAQEAVAATAAPAADFTQI